MFIPEPQSHTNFRAHPRSVRTRPCPHLSQQRNATLLLSQIWIPNGGGSKDNPAAVPSQFSQRTLGIDNPNTQQLIWFNAKKGELTYVAECDKYFTLVDP